MRKTKEVTITDEGRDKGKTFLLTEMSSRQAEKWADRAFLCLAHSSANLPAGIERTGMAGIAQVASLIGGVQFPELSPLMDELLSTCVQVIPDPELKKPDGSVVARALRDGMPDDDLNDLQEVATRQFLRREVMDLHVNFSLAATILNLIAAASEMTTLQGFETTQTSPRRSRRLSRAA